MPVFKHLKSSILFWTTEGAVAVMSSTEGLGHCIGFSVQSVKPNHNKLISIQAKKGAKTLLQLCKKKRNCASSKIRPTGTKRCIFLEV